MKSDQSNDAPEATDIRVGSVGCGVAVFSVCLFLVLISPNFWSGLRSVIEAMR